jgi:programmed cell death protein 5
MSDDELEKIRQKRMEELQRQAYQQQAQNQMQKQQSEEFEQQKNMLLRVLLSSDARVRLENLRLARKEFAENIEMQLIELYQKGILQKNFALPMSDESFKDLLIRAQDKKRDTKIRII